VALEKYLNVKDKRTNIEQLNPLVSGYRFRGFEQKATTTNQTLIIKTKLEVKPKQV